MRIVSAITLARRRRGGRCDLLNLVRYTVCKVGCQHTLAEHIRASAPANTERMLLGSVALVLLQFLKLINNVYHHLNTRTSP